MEVGCKIVALPPAPELALPSDNSKLNCMGLKEDILHNRVWPHFKVEEPCNSVTLGFL